jgi:uncharacterized protein (DUF2235 family)
MYKHIVLLSDGTGNGSASPFKTNVWRVYQALDIAQPSDQTVPRQIAYYDNGVGTESLKPLAALGSTFGIGVWKNVKDLYTFICRNYQIGDRIYGFGFSRGAFTIRLVMGLIGKCGIVKPEPHSEAALLAAVQAAYEAYRRDFLIRASRHRGMIYHHVLRGPRYLLDDVGKQTNVIDLSSPELGAIAQMFVDIPFLGVWDTVDAYGMPVDELKLAIDQKVWPMSFADRDPSRRLQMIRHALSLDDERPTFRPVLWNEVLRKPDSSNDPEILGASTIQQIWFAGVHANVGGGYPDDGLAYASLDWMMDEAQVAQLRFEPAARLDIANRADPHGEQYDSRAGIAGYYRYGPRRVKELCADRDHGVNVPVVRVHSGAFDRIAGLQCAYAPVSLNCTFSMSGDVPRSSSLPDFLGPEDDVLERAWDIVWWRRLAYFTTLAVTAYLTLFALRLAFTWPNWFLDATEATFRAVFGARIAGSFAAAWTWLLGLLTHVLPDWANVLVPSFDAYPLSSALALTLLAVSFFWIAERLQDRIAAHAEWAWAAQKGLPLHGEPSADWLNTIARPGRVFTAWLYRLWRAFFVYVAGYVLGIIALIAFSPFWVFRVFRRRAWMA